ncbi:SDR family oxidoreductase [Kitasatospora sp. NPDC058397]|uniref:SDR family oxidoreductase n=1 Tax=unclassified Kitasatospora TaxID=2633591 RepID=UPI00366539A5
MIITVFGATGRTGSRVVSLLLDAGHQVRAVSRDRKRTGTGGQQGPAPVLGDLTAGTTALAELLTGSDAVVNCAGVSSPRSRDLLRVDRDGAIAAVEAAQATGVRRYVQVSAMPADRADQAPLGFRSYLRAKYEADLVLARSGLEWTVLRPGGLTDRSGGGRIALAPALPDGSIPRDDLAAVVVAALSHEAARNRALDVTSGTLPIEQALAGLAAG